MIFTHIDDNNRLLEKKAILPFERGDGPATSADPYFSPRPELNLLEPVLGLVFDTSSTTEVNLINYTLLLFNFNHITGVCCFCIPLEMAKAVIEIIHKQKHQGFGNSYEIVFRS